MVLIKGVGWVSSVVWVGEKQLDGRTDEVLVMKGASRVSSTIWVGEKQLDERTSGG